MRKHPGLQSYTKEIMSVNETFKYGTMSAGPLCHPNSVTRNFNLKSPFSAHPNIQNRPRAGCRCMGPAVVHAVSHVDPAPCVSPPSRSDAKPCLSPSRREWSGVIRMATWFVPEANPWSSPEPQPLYAMVL